MKAWLTLLSIALLAGCARDANLSDWVERSIEAHQAADAALARGDAERAYAALEPLARGEAPSGIEAADARAVQQDACFRLAQLDLERGEAEAALRWVDVGLARGVGQDLYTANLLIARGRARHALGDDLQAAKDYHAALRINEALMDEALGEEGAVE